MRAYFTLRCAYSPPQPGNGASWINRSAACIVGLAVLTTYYHPQGWHGIVAGVVWVAIVIALIAMARIAWSTLRKGG